MKKTAFIITLIMLLFALFHIFVLHDNGEFIEGDLYDEIISRGKIKVGVSKEAKPFAYTNEKGEIVGYDVDLAKYIAQYIVKNREAVEIVPIATSDRLIMASTGEVDIVISTLTITPQREELVRFSIPYDVAGQAVMVKTNSEIRSLSDLNGQIVGVVFGTTAEKNMPDLVPTANLRGFKTYKEAYQALKAGHINAITSDDTILCGIAFNDKDVKVLPKRYSKEPYGIAFKKSASTIKLKEHLDFAIEDLHQKNVIPRLRRHWRVGI